MGLKPRVRIAVLARDGYRCVYCGATPARVHLQVDHVIPKARGGSDDPLNLVTACVDCNQGKSSTPLQLPAGVVPGPIAERPRWQLRPGRVFDRRFDDFRPYEYACDDCGARADTAHWLPYRAGVVTSCKFACPRHDLGGYWLAILDLFSGPQDWNFQSVARRYTGVDHVRDKNPQMARLLLQRLADRAQVSA
jgi:hypothetical protein